MAVPETFNTPHLSEESSVKIKIDSIFKVLFSVESMPEADILSMHNVRESYCSH